MCGCLRLSCLPGLCSIDLSFFDYDIYAGFAIKLALLLPLLGICSTTTTPEDVPDQFHLLSPFQKGQEVGPKNVCVVGL